MRKISFPRYVIVLAVSLSALINLFFNLIVVSIFMFFDKTQVSSVAVLLPLIIVELFVFSLSVSLLLSALYVKFRDIGFIWEVAIQGAFFAIPIMYAFSFVTKKSLLLGKILMCNPLAQLMQDARYMLINRQSDTIYSVFGSKWAWAIPAVIVVVTSVLSIIYFKRQSPYFAEEV